MPYKPNKPCKHPGCPNLVPSNKKYCKEHLPLHPEYTRPPAERGYDGKWRKARKVFLKEHPLCEHCKQKNIYTAAEVVDHIIPHRGNKGLFWDTNNWQALCKRCHDRKTRKYDNLPTYKYR